MSAEEPRRPAAGLIARALSLLWRPVETWTVIDDEPSTIEALYRAWVIPLAAIPPVCRMIGMLGFGDTQIFGVRYRPNFLGVISEAVATYALNLAAVYVLALVLDAFATRFGGQRSRTQAFKLAAYSGSAGWLAGVFMLAPKIGGLIELLGGLYGLYLLYLGLPVLMRSDPERTLPYFVLSLVATLILALLIGSLVSCVGGWGGPVVIS